MHSAIALLTATALLSAACAPPSIPARDATSALPERVALAAPGASTTSAATTAVRPVVSYAASDATEPPIPEPTPTTHKVSDEDRGSAAIPRAIGWVSLGIGISSGLVALGTSIMMLQQESTRNSDCDGKLCSAAGLAANSQLQGLSGWNVGSYIVAAAGLGIGAYLILANPATGDKQTAIGVSPTNSGAGLVLRSTF